MANESYRNFDSRFRASMSKYSSHATSVSLPSSIFGLMLLHNAEASNFQRVPILSAAASRALAGLEFNSNDETIDTVS